MSANSLHPALPHGLKILFTAASMSVVLSQTALAGGPGFAPGPAGWDYYSKQNLLIGATLPLQASASYGQGVTVATIDTGIESSWVGFGGLNVSSYSCLNNVCGSAAANSDDNGHGTFVASEIIGGAMFSTGNGMIGVAPFANLVAIKALDAQGSGSSTDVSNGIKFAVDHGAKVLNLSLGPSGPAAGQVAFWNSLAGAINYAASKNAVIVFAGGNDASNFSGNTSVGRLNQQPGNPNLFTDAALQRMFFMGATDSNKQLTSYSNMPGWSGFYSTTGKFYNYKYMWLMADGGGVANNQCVDCIVGAPNVANANYLALDAGTSMATPQGAGAAALLAARWPVLLTNGTIPKLLEATAQDLGVKGPDVIYGSGFLNLAQAFQPVGGLSVYTRSGTSVSVTQGSSQVLTSGALGSMSKISAALSNYTAFDTFQRDFNVNLSGLVGVKSTSSQTVQTVSAPKTSTSSVHFADGSSLAFGNINNDNQLIDHPASTSTGNQGWFMSFSDASGATMAAGSGFPASASFAGALWGVDSAVASGVTSLGVSDSLLNLAEGGTFVAFGDRISKDSRVAFSWTQTQAQPVTGMDWTQPDATSFSTGLTSYVTPGWQAGVTLGLLDEQNGLLGTTYEPGAVGLGETHQSLSIGVSSAITLADKLHLVLDAAIVRADGSQIADGILSDISPLYARTLGAALVERDAMKQGDNLSLSVRAPLKVFSGSASLATTSVDANGNPVTDNQRISLTPDGTEVDFNLGYAAPVNDMMSMTFSAEARRDADNIRNINDEAFLIGSKLSF